MQQSPHSTLVSYLNKLLWILTGNFGRPGTMHLHSSFASVAGAAGGGSGRGRVTPVTGARIISGLVPCNSITEEILTDHPDRFRAMWVDSSNPAHSLADSARFREALAALDLVVVVDVALTETGRLADYRAAGREPVREVRVHVLQRRVPAQHLPTAPSGAARRWKGRCREPEIYARVLRALGAVDDEVITSLRESATRGRDHYRAAFFGLLATRPELTGLAPYLVQETLGAALPVEQRPAAAVWGLAQLCAMSNPEAVRRAGHADGDALFDAIMATPTGIVFTVDDWHDVWSYVRRTDKRFTVAIPELPRRAGEPGQGPGRAAHRRLPLRAVRGRATLVHRQHDLPRPRMAATRPRGGAADQCHRRRRLGLVSGQAARVTTADGSATTLVEVSDTMQPGHISLPNGYGLSHPDEDAVGVAPNELTGLDRRDPIAGTPWHKNVPARVEAL